MKKIAAPLTLALGATILLAGCASYEGVEPSVFAKSSCGVMGDLYALEEDSVVLLENLSEISDESITALTDQGTRTIEALTAAKTTVGQNQPAVKEGDDITGYFNTYFDERIAAAEAAATVFEKASATEDINEFSDAAFNFLTGISDSEEFTFPFELIKNQKVVDAIDDEATCKDIVAVS